MPFFSVVTHPRNKPSVEKKAKCCEPPRHVVHFVRYNQSQKIGLEMRYVTSQNPTAMARHLELSYGVRNTINPLSDNQNQVSKTKALWGLKMMP